MKTREEALNWANDKYPGGSIIKSNRHIGAMEMFDWLNELEQSEPKELTADDFVGITATNLCVGCYFFEQNKNCPNWRECDGIIYKLKEAKQ